MLNIGSADRTIRFIVGLGLLTIAFAGAHSAWGYVGLIALLTAIVGWCPAYSALGISTRRHEPDASSRIQAP
jgi:hypothetical protein